MRVPVALLLALVACSENRVSIEVHVDETGATMVELYAVDDYCRDPANPDEPCKKLKTPSSPDKLGGEIYTRKDASRYETPVESDGVGYFSLRPDGKLRDVPLAVVVGRNNAGKIVGGALMGVGFSASDGNRRIVHLDKVVDDHVTGSPMTDGLRIETWYEEMGDGGCLAFEERVEGVLYPHKFIVPEDDTDCDDHVAPLECDEFWPDFAETTSAPLLDFTCVADISTGNGIKACLLGDAGCTDGFQRSECTPTPSDEGPKYCVPGALCEDAPAGCKGGGQTCAFTRLKDAESVGATRVHCVVPVEPFNVSNRVCGGQAISYDIGGSNTLPVGAECVNASIAPITGNGFDTFVAVENNVDVHVSSDCTVQLIFQEQFAAADTRYLDNWVLRIDLDNGHSVIVPLFIELVVETTGCNPASGGCELESENAGMIDPSFVACARLPP